MRTKTLASFLGLALVAVAATGPAQAQQVTNTVALGSDFWTGSMAPELFQLHENGGDRACSGTEVFVTVRGNLGFCMDANENAAGSLEWEDARGTCATAGKRLPEPAEYKFACQAGIPGLNNMTDDAEWASNFWTPLINPFQTSGAYGQGAVTIKAGNGSCVQMVRHFIGADPTSAVTTSPFRCVR